VFVSFHFHLSILVPDGAGLFYAAPQPTTLNFLRQYALAHPLRISHSSSRRHSCTSIQRVSVLSKTKHTRPRPHRRSYGVGQPAGGKLLSYGTASCESMGRGVGVRPQVWCRQWEEQSRRTETVHCAHTGPSSQGMRFRYPTMLALAN
jgi:hypothetical protein